MIDIKNWAIEETKKAGWNNNEYHSFLLNSNQSEFLLSQIPFFYAVKGFPRMLCRLASLIEDSEERLLVVENIYEEHGHSNTKKFHTETYKEYLSALGWDGQYHKNPWVEEWINKVLNLPYNATEYSIYLSAIEYIYALICSDISTHINKLNLKHEQSHYKKHAQLDWEHGYELLSVAIKISNIKSGELPQNLKMIFNESQKDFLKMYESLRIPTRNEIKEINQEKIAFYYSREDSLVERKNLENFNKEKISIFTISSGGEHVFEYLTSKKSLDIDVMDINPHQIELSALKLTKLLEGNYQDNIFLENNIGKFEKIFTLLRSYFTKEELTAIEFGLVREYQKLNYIVNILFSNDYLNIVFGEDATKYTQESFSHHFFNIFIKKLNEKEKNTHNIFYGSYIRNYEDLSNNLRENYNNHTLTWYISYPRDFVFNKNYDIINISNIGDWMSQENYNNLLVSLVLHLNNGGCIIARKLLGDYSLLHVLESHGLNCRIEYDSTGFYTETVIAYKS